MRDPAGVRAVAADAGLPLNEGSAWPGLPSAASWLSLACDV
jgi:hypothetical protein